MGGQRSGIAQVTQCIPTKLKGTVASLYSYFDSLPYGDLFITSYGDNSSLLNREEAFHTRDIDSLSLCTKLAPI